MYAQMKKEKIGTGEEEGGIYGDDEYGDDDFIAQFAASTADCEEQKEGGESAARPTSAPLSSHLSAAAAADREEAKSSGAAASHPPEPITCAAAAAVHSKWTHAEDEDLMTAVERTPLKPSGRIDWSTVATHTNGRSAKACTSRFSHLIWQHSTATPSSCCGGVCCGCAPVASVVLCRREAKVAGAKERNGSDFKLRLSQQMLMCKRHDCMRAATMINVPCGHRACDECDALRRLTDKICRGRSDDQQQVCERQVNSTQTIGQKQ